MSSRYHTKIFRILFPILCITALFLGGCLAGNPRYHTDSKKYHIVEKGDNLSKIALENGTSVKKIMLYNTLVSDLIFPGQKLYLYPKINGKNEYITVRGIPKKGYHLVKQKETLQRISRMYNLSILDLLDYNSKNSFEINAGEKIWLVAGKINPDKINLGKSNTGKVEKEDYAKTEVKSKKSNNKVVAEKKSVTKSIPDDLNNENLAKSEKPEAKMEKVNIAKPESKKKKSVSILPEGGKVTLPVNGTVTSEFGMRKGKPHKGIDIAAAKGTPIIAALAGKAVYVGSQRGYGNVVILEHENLIMTVYAHNEANLIRLGDKVKDGQPIATVGNTGVTTGSHLHFEYRVKGKAVNPREVLPKF